MRTTVRIDDDLMGELKQRAHAEGTSLTRMINRLLRRGLEHSAAARPRRPFRQKTFRMGKPSFEVNKALQVAAALDDAEILRKLRLRK